VRLGLGNLELLEPLRDELATFGGWALRDLARYRCRDGLVSCLKSLPDSCLSAFRYLSWLPKPYLGYHRLIAADSSLSTLQESPQPVTQSPLKPSGLDRDSPVSHQLNDWVFCSRVHIMHGWTFCTLVENKLARALGQVSTLKPYFL
jgi:hypothetical protein